MKSKFSEFKDFLVSLSNERLYYTTKLFLKFDLSISP